VKLGLHIAATNWRGGPERLGETLAHAAEAAEAAGFDAISVTDHVWGSQYTGGVEASQVEAYTTLGFIAARSPADAGNRGLLPPRRSARKVRYHARRAVGWPRRAGYRRR